MKRKRFYNNKHRNEKWTETETGRPIDFADKYSEDDKSGNMFVKADESRSSVFAERLKNEKRKRRALIAGACVLLILLGFFGAQIHMARHEAPLQRFNNRVAEHGYDPMSELRLSFAGESVPPISLDGSVMLSAVIDEALKNGKSAVMFDAKRSDGTVGYASGVSAAKSLGAVSAPGTKPALSVRQLGENDILPLARVYTYLDNTAPAKAGDMALKKGKKLYRDGDGNTYLNPESEVAYGYLRDIVSELYSYGITVIILDGCTVKDTDYFDALSARLTKDIGSGLRLVEAVNVTLTGYDAESGDVNAAGIKNEIDKFPKLKDNQVLILHTGLKEERFASRLAKKNISAYVIDER